MAELDDVRGEAKQGALLREGMKVVIAGRPNAGKSSLLNALAGRESAIVTEIAGTTRDVLREHIHLDGMPLHIIDTAGLRDTQDKVEQIGIERAWAEIEQADRVLFMVDGTTTDAVDPREIWPEFVDRLPKKIGLTVVRNKADLTGEDLEPSQELGHAVYRISAKPESGKKGEAYGQPQPIEEKRQGRHGKRRQTARTARKRQRKNCNMQSWERAQPLSPFEVSPDGTGRRFCLENSGWRDPLGYHNAAKYPPADFFIDLVLCVVGRFACQVPNLSATRTAIPERFFGRKITAGNFMSRKPKA
jgi:small GTP-binding protein